MSPMPLNFTITPDPGYHVADVKVNGSSVGAVTSYSFFYVMSDQTISATFAADPHNITAFAYTGGTISPPSIVVVPDGGNQTFTIAPDAGQRILEVLIDGISYGTISSYTFTNVTADHTISASFTDATNFVICPTAGSGGSLSPSGAMGVAPGTSQTFTITPDIGEGGSYRILDVLVDGVSMGPGTTTYTFTNVQADHTITAYFTDSYNFVVWATNGPHGIIDPYGGVGVYPGDPQSFTITPDTDAGYHVADVLVNGSSVGPVTSYDFSEVTADQTISATFALNPVVTASAGPNGSISPSGAVSVPYGSNQSFNLSPNPGYYVADILLDGSSMGLVNVSSVTLNNVTINHTLSVSFAPSPVITTSAGAGGLISPSGSLQITYGSSAAFSILPNANYHIVDVLVDGSSVGAVSSYTFTNVTANHTIQASFAIDTRTITASAGANGSISPVGAVPVNYGANQTFTITPAANYHVADVLVDGVPWGP